MEIKERASETAKQVAARFPQLHDADLAPLADIVEHALVEAMVETLAHCKSSVETRFDPKSEAALRLSGELGDKQAALRANLTAMR